MNLKVWGIDWLISLLLAVAAAKITTDFLDAPALDWPTAKHVLGTIGFGTLIRMGPETLRMLEIYRAKWAGPDAPPPPMQPPPAA